MSAEQKQLLRQLEGHMRQGRAVTDTRWHLTRTGMTEERIFAFERTIRHRIREERTGRRIFASGAAKRKNTRKENG
jgi:hypothetical protein